MHFTLPTLAALAALTTQTLAMPAPQPQGGRLLSDIAASIQNSLDDAALSGTDDKSTEQTWNPTPEQNIAATPTPEQNIAATPSNPPEPEWSYAAQQSHAPARRAVAVVEKRFVPGWCTAHIIQYQKNEGPGPDTSEYRLDVKLYDGVQDVVGGVVLGVAREGEPLGVTSGLPYVFLATVGSVDDDSIGFDYAGKSFSTSSEECRFGFYDGGKREGDCGFTCNAAAGGLR